eukprot:TRINITY_DN5543_c0_g1_i1.p1 TRINITY_DN5543_c0_g1~~TRINITY_DN5543_c0_g1_i1.p1  ORF type:complete len:140 (-),score=27.07 TRINITY_DN5543_c0_g1_i1:283-702(-)
MYSHLEESNDEKYKRLAHIAHFLTIIEMIHLHLLDHDVVILMLRGFHVLLLYRWPMISLQSSWFLSSMLFANISSVFIHCFFRMQNSIFLDYLSDPSDTPASTFHLLGLDVVLSLLQLLHVWSCLKCHRQFSRNGRNED